MTFDSSVRSLSLPVVKRAIAIAFFVNGATYGTWATQIPVVQKRLELPPSILGVELFLLGVGAVAAMASSGWFIQRAGAAFIIRASAAIFCVMLPLVCLAPDRWTLGVALFLFGASGGCMDVAMNAAASDFEKRADQPHMSMFHGMWSVGGLIGAVVAAQLLKFAGSSLQALLMAVILGGVFGWGQRHLADGRTDAPADGSSTKLHPSAAALLIGAMMALSFAGEGAVLDWAAIYLRDALATEQTYVTSGFVAFSLTMALGRFCGDTIRARLSGAILIRAGCALAFVGLLAGPVSGSAVIAVVGYALAGVGISNIVPVLFSAAGALPRPEAQIAAVSTMGYAGLLAAPPLLGLVAQASSLAAIFYIVAGANLVIAALAGACAPDK